MSKSTLDTIRQTIENGSLATMRRRVTHAEESLARRSPKDPGYAHSTAQLALQAAEDRARLDGYEEAMRQIFGMIESAVQEEKR